ncbi:probable mediator of RNA polymerase II transcription subunit 26b [Phragmites australis]|uniref:probable mediator of RNA polymerase II transcription subunit 26b n=1 Tax=Phragmites australis TaxID=29695 RepID=UPI002D797C4D|nr:probable mediator of RNA polymerase II transcription subunit 26b [Phragmites australis]
MAAGNSSLAIGMDNTGLEPWREFFGGLDIFEVIGHAILVAATDSPLEFRRHRDGIVEQIYRASAIPAPGRDAGEGPGGASHVSEKRRKMTSCKGAPQVEPEDDDEEEEIPDQHLHLAAVSNQHVHGYGDNANAYREMGMEWLHTLVDQMDDEIRETNEVLRIKAILLNHHEKSADILFESLKRLQLMQLTVDKLKNTDIGGAVTALSKHNSHKIRKLVRAIVKGWKVVADEWIAATKATMNKSLDKSNPSAVEDEGGLAIPAMDVGAFFVSPATAIQHVSEKTGMPAQSLAGPNVGIGKRKIQLANMGLETTKRKLHEAYQEAENGCTKVSSNRTRNRREEGERGGARRLTLTGVVVHGDGDSGRERRAWQRGLLSARVLVGVEAAGSSTSGWWSLTMAVVDKGAVHGRTGSSVSGRRQRAPRRRDAGPQR